MPDTRYLIPESGRPGGNRTPNLRFWRPPLCQLSYWPVVSLRPAYSILWRRRRRRPCGRLRGSQSAAPLPSLWARSASPSSVCCPQASPSRCPPATPRCPSRPWSESRTAADTPERTACAARLPPCDSTYTSQLNLVCGVMTPGFASTCPRSTSSRLVPLQQHPDVVPRLPLIQELPEHLHPRAHRLRASASTPQSPAPRPPSPPRAPPAPSPPSPAH